MTSSCTTSGIALDSPSACDLRSIARGEKPVAGKPAGMGKRNMHKEASIATEVRSVATTPWNPPGTRLHGAGSPGL